MEEIQLEYPLAEMFGIRSVSDFIVFWNICIDFTGWEPSNDRRF
jgi:hypothetical protein